MPFIIRLSPEDQQRLGAPEEFEFDDSKLMLSEMRVLETELGLSPEEFLDGLGSKPILDAEGNEIPGRRTINYVVWGFGMWMSLRRIGVDLPFAEFDYDLNATGIRAKPVEVVAPDPKDPSTRAKPSAAAKKPSATSSTPTSRRSRTSTASPRTSSRG